MRVALCLFVAMVISGGASGCALFGGKSDGSTRRWWFSSAKRRQPSTTPSGDPLQKAAVPFPRGDGISSQVDGVLAGEVQDAATSLRTQAFIRYTCLDEPQTKAAPIDVATRRNGYFVIYGLKVGKRYKLLAYSQKGEKKLADVQYAIAPNPHLVFRLRRDVNPADIPDVPRPSTLPSAGQSKSADDRKEDDYFGTQSSKEQTGFGIGKPRALDGTRPGLRIEDPPQISKPKQYLPNIASNQDDRSRIPTAKTPAFLGKPQLPFDRPNTGVADAPSPNQRPAVNSPMPKVPASLRTLPFAVVLSKQIINFGMRDAYGRTWEWKTDRRGQLMLIDFWRTNCPPCLAAIPELRALQQRYGADGLEVIGIACEQGGGPFERDKIKVAKLVNLPRFRTNYRLLINSGPRQSEVLDQFQVHSFPTLLLVDERGDILWKHVGGLSRSDLGALDNQIRRRLRTNIQ